jgi:hypothetical protein
MRHRKGSSNEPHRAGRPAGRGAIPPADALLRYRTGQAITSRRHDHLWKRIGEQLPWVAAQGLSTHWLRHNTLTWVERHFGYGSARAYAPTPPARPPPPTSRPICTPSPPPCPP